MAQLIVRNLPDDLVLALKRRAACNRHSAEQEHREILQAALRGTRHRSFAQLLAEMPNVGKDADFTRIQTDGRQIEFG
jgi:antitoxin FitA